MTPNKALRAGWRAGLVSLIGLVVSITVAGLVALADQVTGFDLFSLHIWLIVPAGPFITGIAAASGYYFASVYFHTRAGWLVSAQMVIVAALTNVLIYWIPYQLLTLDGRLVHEYINFPRYMQILFEHQEMRVGRAMVKTGELGSAGIWLAGVDFVGFLLGGLTLFVILLRRPTCVSCARYLHERTKTQRFFANSEEASAYYDGLFENPLNSHEFATQSMLGEKKHTGGRGSLHIETKIMECPECSRQTWADNVQIWNGKSWSDQPKLARSTLIPLGTNAVPFVAARARSQ